MKNQWCTDIPYCTCVANVRALFWTRTKAHKTFTNTKMKREACLKKMESSDTFTNFLLTLRGVPGLKRLGYLSEMEAALLFTDVSLETSWLGGNLEYQIRNERHTAVVNRKYTTWKLCLKIPWGPCTQVSNYQSSGDFLSRQRIEGHVWWWISYKGIGCLNNCIQGFCHDVAMISGLVTWGPTRTAIFWGTKPIDLWI